MLVDYLLQPSRVKRRMNWNHVGFLRLINQYTVSLIQYVKNKFEDGTAVSEGLHALTPKKDGPTECLTLSRNKNLTAAAKGDYRV